jgi:hypothetical protein
VRALQLAGEELQPDIGGAQLLGERRKLDAAVTQRFSARYRHWPFRCCSSPATASMRIGTEAGVPPIHDTGTVATWIAAAVWAAVFTWMTGSIAGRLRAGT